MITIAAVVLAVGMATTAAYAVWNQLQWFRAGMVVFQNGNGKAIDVRTGDLTFDDGYVKIDDGSSTTPSTTLADGGLFLTGVVESDGGANFDENVTVAGIIDFDSATVDGTDSYIEMPEITAPGSPAANTGRIYVADDGGGTTTPYFKDSAGVATSLIAAAAGGNTLDQAYDQGGAGSGNKINADSNEVEIEVADTSANVALLLDNNDVTGNPDTLSIDNAGTGDAIAVNSAGGGLDFDGTVATIAANGDVSMNDLTAVDGTFSGNLYIPALVSAAAGNVNLTIDAAGTGTIAIGNTSTGRIYTTNAAVDIGDAASDTLTITSSVDADLVFDDQVTDSPKATFTAATNNSGSVHQDNTTDDLILAPSTANAADGVRVLTGNLMVGNGVPGVALNGEDAYIEGTLEVDGATQMDGALVVNSTVQTTGGLNCDESIDIDFDANDEYFTVTSNDSAYAADAIISTFYGEDATGSTNDTTLVGLMWKADADANDIFFTCSDNDGDEKFAIGPGGNTAWTLDAAAGVVVDKATTDSTVDGLAISHDTNTNGMYAIDIDSNYLAGNGVGEYSGGIYINLDDDSDAAGYYAGIFIDGAEVPHVGSSTIDGLWIEDMDAGVRVFTPAAGKALFVDAYTNDLTNTDGAIDIQIDTLTNGVDGVRVDLDWLDAADSAVGNAFYADLDDDDTTLTVNESILRGFSAVATDVTGNALVQGFYTGGAEVALQADTGYVRIGNLGTPDVTPGDGDLYAEGTVEVDGATRLDGALTLNAALTQTLGAGEALTIDADTTAHTGTAGAINMDYRSATTISSAFDLNVESDVAGGASEVVRGIVITLDDDANTASDEVVGIQFGSTGDATGLQYAMEVTGAGIDYSLKADSGRILCVDPLELGGASAGTSPIEFEGTTDNSSETGLTVEDPTADRIITLPDYSGSVPLVSNQGFTQTDCSGVATATDITGSSISLPDGWFTAGKAIRYTIGGTSDGSGGAAMSLAIYVDDAQFGVVELTTSQSDDWYATFTMYEYTDAAHQKIIGVLDAEGEGQTVEYDVDTTNFNDGGATTVKLQGNTNNAADHIYVEFVTIETWSKN